MSDEREEDQLPEIDETITGEASPPQSSGPAEDLADLGLVLEVPLRLSVEVGSARLLVRDVLSLTKDSVIELDRMEGEPADVYVNDRLLARGEIVKEDDRVAVRLTELISSNAKMVAD